MHSGRIISKVIFCLYIAAVAYLCFARPDDIPQLPTLIFGLPADKVGHFLMFLPFPPLGFLTFGNGSTKPAPSVMIIMILCIVGLGMAFGVEHIQAQLEYRSAEKGDILADGAGLASGAVITMLYILFRKDR